MEVVLSAIGIGAVSICFITGASLIDKDKLLNGSGNVVRGIRLLIIKSISAKRRPRRPSAGAMKRVVKYPSQSAAK